MQYSGFNDLYNTGQKAKSVKRGAEIKIRAFLAFLWSDYLPLGTHCALLYSHANCPQIGLTAFHLRRVRCKDH